MFDQWIRRIELLVANDVEAIDLSEFRIVFQVNNADVESPSNASMRIYNLSKDTVYKIINSFSGEFGGEFTKVILNAGYTNGNFGAIFKGTIKQHRVGRENNTDTYLDILAADGDIGYNQGIVATVLAAGATIGQGMAAAAAAMPDLKFDSSSLQLDTQHAITPRGQVLMGMARARLRNYADTLDSTWSIQSEAVVVVQKSGYLSNEVVSLNVGTGLIGTPEQTDQGIKLTCLLNSKIRLGGRVRLNNNEITQLMQSNPNAAPIAYNQWAAFQANAAISGDGVYRAYAVEHEGDSRGRNWQTNLICLAVNESAPQNESVKAP